VQAHLSHIKLLVVEDFDINRKILKQFFINWWELTPDEAVNGQEAIAMAQKEQYDLILMDIRMPVMNGYQAAHSIRNLPNNKYQKVPIIALTADTLHEIEKHPEAALFTDVITKPFDPEDLQQKLIRYAPRKKMKADHSSGVPATGVPANTSSPQVDIKKVEAFCKGNTKHIKLFLEKAIHSLQSFQKEFETIISQRNTQALSDLKHKLTLLLDMLALEDMKVLLEQSKLLLKENAPQDQLHQIQKKQTMMVEQIVAALEEHL
jgi:CheY-like chemotaxis protein